MLKKLATGTILGGLCVGAYAEPLNVEIYGVLDVNAVTISGDGKRFTGVEPGGISGSRLGFRASRDLGDGLNAFATIEFGSLKNDREANDVNKSRQSFVGVSSPFGTLAGGRIYSPADDFNTDFSGLSNSGLLEPRSNMLNDGGFSTKVDDTLDNAVAYTAPSFAGVTLRAVVGFGEQTVAPKETKYAFAAEYKGGPFRSTLLHHTITNVGGVAPAVDLNETAIGLRYDFAMLQLMGTYVTTKTDGSDSDEVMSVGVRIPAGPGTVRISYAQLDEAQANGDKDASGWAAAYYWDLDKMTTVYAGVHTLDNSSAASYSHEKLTGLSAGSNATLATLGLRYKF